MRSGFKIHVGLPSFGNEKSYEMKKFLAIRYFVTN